MKITFVTSNRAKFRGAREILGGYGIRLARKEADLQEIQSLDVKEVALDKAIRAGRDIGGAFIVDDSGFYIKAMNGFPGALLKMTHASIGDRGILAMCRGRPLKAAFASVLVFSRPGYIRSVAFSMAIEGRLAGSPRGTRDVGWAVQRIFVPAGYNKTIAQLDNSEWKRFWGHFKVASHYAKLGRWLAWKGMC
jgi:XTP/dITP diphosphohydrolase